MAEETLKPKGLIKKLCEVMSEAGYIQKRGHNEKFNYDYATEADVVDMLREKLASRGVFIFPSVVSAERKEHSKTSTGATMFVTDIMVKWTFLDGETGEVHECIMPGCGTDTGDKGIYKAITGSSKYMFLKAFMLPTGDDPEKEKADNGKESRHEDTLSSSKAEDRTVHLTHYKERYVAISGPGWPLMELDGKTKAALGFRWEGNVAMIETKHGFEFVALCEKHNMGTVWMDAPTGNAAPKAEIPPAPEPQEDGRIIHGTKERSGVRIDPRTKNKINWALLEVTWGDEVFVCWHESMWEYLKKGKGMSAELETVPSFDKKKQATIEGILWIGNTQFSENVPVLQQSAR